jgi:ribonucleoside-diphosphate reductase alpha chain
MQRIAAEGHIHWPEVPEEVQRAFVTAHDITPEWHVRMQAGFQEHCDSAISKTTNFPHEATVEDVRQIYELAYQLNCKGVTVYRDGSRDAAPLTTGKTAKSASERETEDALTRAQLRVAQLEAEVQKLRLRSSPETALPAKRQKRKRPDVLKGSTRKMGSPLGDVYVTINEDDGHHPFEVFATLGKAGSTAMADIEAIGRLISLTLRFGIPISEVYSQLRGISSDKAIGFGANKVLSVPDAIALAIQAREQEKAGIQQELIPGAPGADAESAGEVVAMPSTSAGGQMTLDGYDPGETFIGVCPDSQGQLEFAEGCQKCHICGYSECG